MTKLPRACALRYVTVWYEQWGNGNEYGLDSGNVVGCLCENDHITMAVSLSLVWFLIQAAVQFTIVGNKQMSPFVANISPSRDISRLESLFMYKIMNTLAQTIQLPHLVIAATRFSLVVLFLCSQTCLAGTPLLGDSWRHGLVSDSEPDAISR